MGLNYGRWAVCWYFCPTEWSAVSNPGAGNHRFYNCVYVHVNMHYYAIFMHSACVHLHMYMYVLCGYTRHLRTCRYAAILANRHSGISQAAAIAVNRTEGVNQNFHGRLTGQPKLGTRRQHKLDSRQMRIHFQ